MEYTIIDGRNAHELYDELVRVDRASLDVETTAVPWYTPEFKLLTIAISTRPGHAYVVAVDHPQAEGTIDLSHLFPDVADQPKWVMQNGQFDWIALWSYGITLRTPWFDTMVAQYLLDVEAPKGLEALAKRWLGGRPWKNIDYKAPENEDLSMLFELNANDADVTLQLFQPMAGALSREPELLQIYKQLMVPAIEALVDMEINGIPVDRGRLIDLHAEVEQEIEDLLTHIRIIAGNEKFNPNSFKQLGKLLYQDLGLPVYIYTDTGNPSTSAEALKKIEHLHPVVELVLRFKKLRKLFTASLTPWLDKLDDNDHLHPRYKPAHVKTGRLASEIPNIQQVPRDPRVRRIFGGLDGYEFVEVDYSQLELRIVAWIAHEEEMLAAFKAGEDLHQVTADAFGVDRQTAKSLNFGLLYGAGPRKLKWIAEEQYGVKLTELQAEALRYRWFAKFTAIQDYHDAAVREARDTGRITTAIGRRRRLPDIKSDDYGKKGGAERQAINTPVQSLGSDITLFKLQELANHPSLRSAGVRPVGTIHDSILLLVPQGGDIYIRLIQEIMEDMTTFNQAFGIELDVPLVTDVKRHTHWGSD